MFQIFLIKGFSKCSETQACKSNSYSKTVFTSIASEYNLTCDKFYLKELAQFFIFFIGGCVAFFFIILQDYYGRKTIFLISHVLCILGGVFTLLIDDLYVKIVGLVFLWSYLDTIFAISFVLYNELSVKGFKNKSNMFFNTMHVAGSIIGTYSTYFLNNYYYLVVIYLSGYLIVLVFFSCLIPESPYYLLKSKQFAKFKNCILYMAETNKLSSFEESSVMNEVETIISSTWHLSIN